MMVVIVATNRVKERLERQQFQVGIEHTTSVTPLGWKTLSNNDLNQVADQRLSLKQWFAVGAHFSRCRKLVLRIII